MLGSGEKSRTRQYTEAAVSLLSSPLNEKKKKKSTVLSTEIQTQYFGEGQAKTTSGVQEHFLLRSRGSHKKNTPERENLTLPGNNI